MWPFRRREEPAAEQRDTPLSEFPDSWLEWLGLAPGGTPVTVQTALRTSIPIARASSVCAGAIAGMGWKAYRTNPAGGRLELRSRLLDDPSREQTAYELRERIALDLIMHGAFYAGIERNGGDVPVFLEPLRPEVVTPERVQPTELNPQGIEFTINAKRYTPRDVFVIRGPSYDSVRGLSLIGVARVAASLGIVAEEWGRHFFENKATPPGLLYTEQNVTQEQADQLQARWQEKVAGANNAGRVPVMGGGIRFEGLSQMNQDAQWVEGRQLTSAQIFSLFGLNGEGVPDNAHHWLNFTLLPYVRRIESRVSRLLPVGAFCELVTESVLRADLPVRYGAYAVGLQNGFLTRNEVRDSETLPRFADPAADEPAPLEPNTGTPNAHPVPALEE